MEEEGEQAALDETGSLSFPFRAGQLSLHLQHTLFAVPHEAADVVADDVLCFIGITSRHFTGPNLSLFKLLRHALGQTYVLIG